MGGARGWRGEGGAQSCWGAGSLVPRGPAVERHKHVHAERVAVPRHLRRKISVLRSRARREGGGGVHTERDVEEQKATLFWGRGGGGADRGGGGVDADLAQLVKVPRAHHLRRALPPAPNAHRG